MLFTQANIEMYLNTIQSTKNLSRKTIIAYRSDLYDFARFLNCTYSPDKSAIVEYIIHLQTERKLKDSSIARKIIALRNFFSYLTETRVIEKEQITFSSFRFRQEKRLPKTLTLTESKKLLHCAEKNIENSSELSNWLSLRNLALIDILISTGIRIAEASEIALSDIVFSERLILIHGKGKRQRLIYISCKQTWNNLMNWLKVRKKMSTNTDKLFVNRYGTQISIHGIEYIFNALKKASGINPQATPHFLRHTFATNLLANGADLRSVQELLGHAHVSTTEIYTEVSAQRKKKVLDKFNYRNRF